MTTEFFDRERIVAGRGAPAALYLGGTLASSSAGLPETGERGPGQVVGVTALGCASTGTWARAAGAEDPL